MTRRLATEAGAAIIETGIADFDDIGLTPKAYPLLEKGLCRAGTGMLETPARIDLF
ncbi:hypothetical protein [Phyllobacterium endophyticum]|uniref:hypothetical protein n=1 Tax=Phyllobacterium endophyticum TaxID=1149773 RepID=UPI001475F6DC|nr:hypothetical protein [Phyllobacterium endophyticum]MBB3237429.1 hypothetical protein [Phyllobacterium endophyticum]